MPQNMTTGTIERQKKDKTSIQLPMLAVEFRNAAKSDSVDIANRQVTYTASDETPVLRFDWWTSCSPCSRLH